MFLGSGANVLVADTYRMVPCSKDGFPVRPTPDEDDVRPEPVPMSIVPSFFSVNPFAVSHKSGAFDSLSRNRRSSGSALDGTGPNGEMPQVISVPFQKSCQNHGSFRKAFPETMTHLACHCSALCTRQSLMCGDDPRCSGLA